MLHPSAYLRHSYDEEEDGIDYTTCILIRPLNNSTQQFIWNRKFEIDQRIVILGNISFQTCVFIGGEYFYKRIVFWPGIIFSLITTPVITTNIFINCWCFSDADTCIWFFDVDVVHAYMLLLFTTISRFVNDILMLFISTSIVVHGLGQLKVGSVSSFSCPTILDFYSCPHGFFSHGLKCLLLFWEFYYGLKCLLLFW